MGGLRARNGVRQTSSPLDMRRDGVWLTTHCWNGRGWSNGRLMARLTDAWGRWGPRYPSSCATETGFREAFGRMQDVERVRRRRGPRRGTPRTATRRRGLGDPHVCATPSGPDACAHGAGDRRTRTPPRTTAPGHIDRHEFRMGKGHTWAQPSTGSARAHGPQRLATGHRGDLGPTRSTSGASTEDAGRDALQRLLDPPGHRRLSRRSGPPALPAAESQGEADRAAHAPRPDVGGRRETQAVSGEPVLATAASYRTRVAEKSVRRGGPPVREIRDQAVGLLHRGDGGRGRGSTPADMSGPRTCSIREPPRHVAHATSTCARARARPDGRAAATRRRRL
jgi:hypothetical protein